MQRLEVSGAVRSIYEVVRRQTVNILQFSFSLSYTGLKILLYTFLSKMFNCFLSLSYAGSKTLKPLRPCFMCGISCTAQKDKSEGKGKGKGKAIPV